jgi:hypothetical protein
MITMSPGCTSCGHDGRLGPPLSPRRAPAVDQEHLVGVAGDRHRIKGGGRCAMPVSATSGLGMKLQADVGDVPRQPGEPGWREFTEAARQAFRD